MTRHTPNSTRTHTLFPYTTRFRSPLLDDVPTMSSYSPTAPTASDVRMPAARTPRDTPGAIATPAAAPKATAGPAASVTRSEEHTSELQSLMRNSYAGFCLKKKKETHVITASNGASTMIEKRT